MLKYLMKLRHRKGFTLTELIIVVAILGVLMGCVAAFATPVRQMVQRTAASTDAITANKIMGDYIESRLAFAERIDALYAVDLTSGMTDFSDKYTAFQNQLNVTGASVKDKAGMLIFHYDPNDEKSTYKIYDINIPKTGGSFNSVVFGTGGIQGAVFGDPFYENSQNIIIAPTEVTKNKLRGNYFAEFQIIPYDCDEDYIVRDVSGNLDPSSLYIKNTTLKDYYAYKQNHIADPALYPDETFGLGTISQQRSGAVENISFTLKNLDGSTGKQWTALNPSGGSGSDIVLFYLIRHY